MDYNKVDDTLRNLVGINPVIQKLEGITSIGNRFSQIMSAAQTITPAVNDNLRSIVGSLGNITSQLPETTTIGHSMGNALNPLMESLQIASQFKYEGALSALSELRQAIIATRDEHSLSSRQIITDSMIDSITPILSSIASASTLAPAIDTSNAADILHSIENAVTDYSSDDISEEEVEEMYSRGEITDEDIEKEVESIFENPESLSETPTEKKRKAARKKALTKVVLLIAHFILGIIFNPVINHITEGVDKKLGVSQTWEESGVFEWIDNLLGLPQNSALTEEEAKSSVNTENIGNQSKQNREELLAKIQAIRTYIASAPQDENTGNLLSYLSDLEKDVNGKKYGLVFEEHRETIDEVLDTHIPVLAEEPELLIDNGGKMNFLLEGDNLAALQLLEKTHRGKIDLIYIDPPYNTGNKDFIYNDQYIDTEDSFRHSKWSSFMGKRLEIAHRLLTEQGVIFIQISDIELAQLRILCDDIFGEENFLNIISVNMKNIAGASGGGEDKRFKKNCEYIIVYAKNYFLLPIFTGAYEYAEIYSVVEQYRAEGKNWHYTSILVDEGEKEYVGSTKDGTGEEIKIYRRIAPIVKSVRQVMNDEHISEKDVYYKYGSRIFEAKDAQSSIRTRVIRAKEEFQISDDIISIEYTPKTGKNKGTIHEQFYKGTKCRLFAWLRDISEDIDGILYKKDLQGTYWDFSAKINNLTKEGNVEFSNGKKPVDLLKRIIALYPNSDATILDFFAGSGTTGHAVISQNVDDEGTRQFILCTDNQNDICKEKTYKRLSNVINGYTNDTGKYFAPMPASLKYYRIDYVPISEQLYYEYADELLLHVRELVELENGVNFTENAEIAIVLTDDELTDFIACPEDFSKCHTLYLGHDILPTGEQDALLKEQDILVHIIPDYYYRGLEG